MFADVTTPSSFNAFADPARFHQRLARWNNRRLAPTTPGPNWMADVREDAEMSLEEGAFVERARAEAAAYLGDLPTDVEGFIAWFEALKGNGPGENDPLFPWLAETASLDQMRWFLLQEVAGEAGFEDLVAIAQVKMPTRPKLELARNYWDEMGRGNEGGMHGPMLQKLADRLELSPTIEGTVWPSLALGNTLVAFSTTRRYAFHALGALGAVELTAPWRAGHVAEGLKRVGVGPERKYFALHATLDVEHSRTWNEEVLRPLAEEYPDCIRSLAEGAVMRLMAGQRCYQAYRDHLWGAAPALRSA
ncbi:iron-containing redox enzyme family protein [Brevundimonas intermedia]|uniref:Iron-containing redox enzyme family protein n=1 Tax=Brevundimonas intermedia TaxID=74315 RepID=A0A4Y9S2R1_9CAUL|nr:iron-containing redox enzyme family protein [Brevundimonas intermedia]TFW14239.1 iron-containing redox enzyme family protein [Brevundimonas intermedia]